MNVNSVYYTLYYAKFRNYFLEYFILEFRSVLHNYLIVIMYL